MISVTRRDLPPAVQAVQSSHCFVDYVLRHPAESLQWNRNSNYMAMLSVKDENDLYKLMEKADAKGIKYQVFREPDLDNVITALCFEPTLESKKLCSSIPLMFKELRVPEMI